MKVPGSITKLAEEVLSGMQREISMLENSKMIKLMDLASTLMSMEADTLASGLMMFKKEKVKKCGLMAPSTKASIRMERSMAMASTCGEMEASSTEIGKTIRLLGTESTTGMTEESTKGIGWRTKCMDKVSTSGQMAGCMKATMLMTRKKAMGSTPTLMVDATKDSGSIQSSMERVCSLTPRETNERENG